jgi:transcription initiation factor TFIIIB Brf1 subunit/transcription initiation factor TFIIB
LVINESLLSTDLNFRFAEKVLYSPKRKRVYLIMRTDEEKVLNELYHEVGIINAILGAPKWFVRDVMEYYMKLYRKGATERRDRLELIGGLYCLLSRRDGLPYSNEDIAFAVFADVKNVLRKAKFVSSELKIKLQQLRASNFIYLIGYELGVDERVISSARDICEDIESNRSYKIILGASYALAAEECGVQIDLKRLARLCGTTEKTLKAYASK